ALAAAYTLVLLVGFRQIFGNIAAHLPPLSRRVLVVGSGPAAESTARMITQYRNRGLYLVTPAAVEGGSARERSPAKPPKPATVDTQDLDRIAAYIRGLDVDDVVITREWYGHNCPDVEHAFTMLNRWPAQVHVAPNPPELLMRISVEDFSGFP